MEPARRRRRRRGGRGRGQDAANAEGLQGDEVSAEAGEETSTETADEATPEQVTASRIASPPIAAQEPSASPRPLLEQPGLSAAESTTAPKPSFSMSSNAAPDLSGAAVEAAVERPAVAPEPQPEAAVVADIAHPAARPAAQADLAAAPAPLAAAAPQALQSAAASAETLPVEQLRAVVETAGLQWVQSDPERVEQARRKARQAPQPRQAPRERKPRAAQQEGPLVLVETRKALPRLDLPENDHQAS